MEEGQGEKSGVNEITVQSLGKEHGRVVCKDNFTLPHNRGPALMGHSLGGRELSQVKRTSAKALQFKADMDKGREAS